MIPGQHLGIALKKKKMKACFGTNYNTSSFCHNCRQLNYVNVCYFEVPKFEYLLNGEAFNLIPGIYAYMESSSLVYYIASVNVRKARKVT